MCHSEKAFSLLSDKGSFLMIEIFMFDGLCCTKENVHLQKIGFSEFIQHATRKSKRKIVIKSNSERITGKFLSKASFLCFCLLNK